MVRPDVWRSMGYMNLALSSSHSVFGAGVTLDDGIISFQHDDGKGLCMSDGRSCGQCSRDSGDEQWLRSPMESRRAHACLLAFEAVLGFHPGKFRDVYHVAKIIVVDR